jgi:hypothetical protein
MSKAAFVHFHQNDILMTVTLGDTGKRKRYFTVSSMLNWCARHGYTPYLEDCDGLVVGGGKDNNNNK